MKIYQTKAKNIPGRHGKVIYDNAITYFKSSVPSTKRRSYIRSKYFKKEKIFLDLFWNHLRQKRWQDRVRRLKFLPCGLELIKNTKMDPVIKRDPKRPRDTLYRFF